MSKILVIDDHPDRQENWRHKLAKHGHEPFVADGDSMTELVDDATALCDQHEFLAVILDMNTSQLRGGEMWGGIWIYLALRNRGVLSRCRNVMIASGLITDHLQSVRGDSSQLVLRVFVEMADIPYENVICVTVNGGYDRCIERISAFDSCGL